MPRLLTARLKYKKMGKYAGSDVYRPVTPIELNKFHKDGSEFYFRTEALIDSGSDLCIFHSEIAEVLGIDVSSGNLYEFFGVGGKRLKGYIHKVGITLAPFPTFSADVVFSSDLNDATVGILGQKCFFDQFGVHFRYSDKSIIIKNS